MESCCIPFVCVYAPLKLMGEMQIMTVLGFEVDCCTKALGRHETLNTVLLGHEIDCAPPYCVFFNSSAIGSKCIPVAFLLRSCYVWFVAFGSGIDCCMGRHITYNTELFGYVHATAFPSLRSRHCDPAVLAGT